MLYATNRFAGDGTTSQYEINFVGGYLDRAHVKAFVEGADLVQTPVTLSSGNFLGQYTIGGLAPVPVGSTLVIYRDTPKAPLVDFVNGSRFTEANLDTATRQGAFIAAEGADAASPTGLAGVINQIDGFSSAAGVARDQAVLSAGQAAVDAVAAGGSASAAGVAAAQALNNRLLADTYAAAASLSADNAALANTGADSARDSAVIAKDATLAALDSLDDRYLGAKAVAPTTDNGGGALVTGALYWDTALPGMRSWNGAAWVTLPAATAAAISNTPSGSVAATTVQGAINELSGVKVDLAAGTGASLVGFQQAGTGAVSTTVHSKLRELVSVKDFGAVGDGVTDDATAINAAIVYANSKGGGTVFFPSGVYRVKSSVQYRAGADLIGESMGNTTLKWHPDTNTAGSILATSNQYLNRARFENLRFTKDASITANTTGILGGSTLANYNSAVACFENLHFDGLTYGIRGNAEPTGVGLFDCYFKNIWCSGCFYGLWLFGSSNRVDNPRMTLCDTAIALDYLNVESSDGMTVTGGTFVKNSYDVGVFSASGIRPVKFIGTWHETSANGLINVQFAGSRVMNLDFIGCMISTSSTVSLFNAANATGTVSIDRCTLISGGLIGGVAASQTVVRPTGAGGRLLIKDCQKYDSVGVASFVSDSNYFEAVKSAVNQSIPSAAYTKLTWAATTIDSAPGFDNAKDTYVIPVKGVYRVVASIAFNPHSVSTNQNQVLLYQNGTFRRAAIGASNSSAATTVTLDCLFAFNAGDTVDIRVFHGNGTAIDVLGGNDLTRFSVQFVSHA